jgi:hypothetical protein
VGVCLGVVVGVWVGVCDVGDVYECVYVYVYVKGFKEVLHDPVSRQVHNKQCFAVNLLTYSIFTRFWFILSSVTFAIHPKGSRRWRNKQDFIPRCISAFLRTSPSTFSFFLQFSRHLFCS